MSTSTPSFGSSAMSYPFSGALVCFDVCLVSGRAAVISCTESERLQDMQVRIAGILELGRDDETPLLQFFKQADSEKEPLDQSTRAAEIVGCTIHVVLQEHPDWYVQKCFSRRSTAQLNWDVDEERTERLSLLPDGQFTYEMRRLAWDEDVGRLAVKEDILHGTGRWRCVLQVGMPGALPEEVLLLDGSANWLSSGDSGWPFARETCHAGKIALQMPPSYIVLILFDIHCRRFWSGAPADRPIGRRRQFMRLGSLILSLGVLSWVSDYKYGEVQRIPGSPQTTPTADEGQRYRKPADVFSEAQETGQRSYAREGTWVPWRSQDSGRWESPRRRTGTSPRRRAGSKGKGAAKGEPAKGKGKGKNQLPTAPDTSQLPAPPKAATAAMPKGMDPGSTGPASEEKKMLAQVMEHFIATGAEVPTPLATLVNQYKADHHRQEGRQLHQLVAKQTQAKQGLAKVAAERAAYDQAWASYLDQLTALVEKQFEAHEQAVLQLDETAEAWTAQLTDVSRALAESTAASSEHKSDMDVEEAAIEEAIEAEAKRKQAVEAIQQKHQSVLEALRGAQKAMRTEDKREGSRTPRRQAKAEEAAAATGTDGGPCYGYSSVQGPQGLPCAWEHTSRHTVTGEWDYVSPALAQLLALQQEYGVKHAELNLFLDEEDKRLQDQSMTRATEVTPRSCPWAEALTVHPPELRAPPIFGAAAHLYTWGGAHGGRPGRFTVFDHIRHVTVERCLPTASLAEQIALAIDTVPFSVVGVYVIVQPVPGLPTPQLVFIERGRPLTELPLVWDLREIGEEIFTLRHESRQERAAAIQQVQPLLRQHPQLQQEVESGAIHMRDALGPVLHELQANLHAVQFFRMSRTDLLQIATWQTGGEQASPSEETSTTTTTTAVRLVPAPIQYPTCRLVLFRDDVAYSCDLGEQHHLVDHAMWRLIQRHGQDAPITDEAQVVLASAQPVRSGHLQDVIAILAEQPRQPTALWDGRSYGRAITAFSYPEIQRTGLLLPTDTQRNGWRVTINGVPDAHQSRLLRHGDYVIPFHGNQIPAVTPLGWPLSQYPSLRPYSWPLAVTASADAFHRRLRHRRLQMGAHLASEGVIVVQGPVHGDLILHTGLHSIPTLPQAQAAVRRLGQFPEGLAFTVTPQVGPTSVTLVSNCPNSELNTVLTPAPGFPTQFLVLLLPTTARCLRSIPADPGVLLTPQRDLEMGDVLQTRAATVAAATTEDDSAEEEPEADETAMLQQHALQARQQEPTPGQAAWTRCTTAHPGRPSVPTPFGRRCVPPPDSAQAAAKKGSIQVAGQQTAAKTRTILSLEQAIPQTTTKEILEHRLSFATSTDIQAEVLAPFRLAKLQQQWRGIPLHVQAEVLLQGLEVHDSSEPVEAALLYTDGSYAPHTGQASWAVAIIVCARSRWRWAGYLSGRSCDSLPMQSAFDAEVAAQTAAHLVCAANGWTHTAICFDATSAAAAAQGGTAGVHTNGIQRAAAASRMHLVIQGQAPRLHHTKSHEGNPGNELADSIATWARAQPRSELDRHLACIIQERLLDWLWLVDASHQGHEWPALDEQGTTHAAGRETTHRLPSAPAAWTMATDKSNKPPVQLHWRVCTYNTLSARSSLQKHSLHTFMRANALDVLALQEARESPEPIKIQDGVYRFASPAQAGQCGCQLWVDTRRRNALWDTQTFAILHSHPRLLAVQAMFAGTRCVLISGHARTAVSTPAEIQTWWEQLRKVLRRLPRGSIPLLCLDANARWTASAPANDNAMHMEALLSEAALASSGAIDCHGRPVFTWTSPQGQKACLDYVLFPQEWKPVVRNQGILPIVDEHAGFDHEPLLVTLDVVLPAHAVAKTHRLDIELMHSPAGKQCIAEIFHSAPRPAWTVGVDEHLDRLNAHFQEALHRCFPKSPQAPRSPIISSHVGPLGMQAPVTTDPP
ncbi:unnamed protein product [Symbiodinium sp. CCMP2456]|nr:unnamed protein product [Symbiodinium sp. CCMP2456]